jgi:hypothetical protein
MVRWGAVKERSASPIMHNQKIPLRFLSQGDFLIRKQSTGKRIAVIGSTEDHPNQSRMVFCSTTKPSATASR